MGRKYLLILALLFSTFSLLGSHLSGGDIQYRYIGDSTGVARHYKVILRVYRDITGIAMPTTDAVTISSGCYANINVPMTLTPGSGLVAPTLFDCVIPGPTTKTLEVYLYTGYVILPGNCSDYRFWYDNCCRPGGINNINGSNGAFGNDGFYFDAKLDNATQGQNSSPVFVSEPVRAFCVGNPFNWKQTVIEANGDSVVYSLINCREGAYPTQTDIPFDAGWSATSPVTSTYFNINPGTGLISFLPTQVEIDVLSVLVEEWRFDTLYGVWYQVGSASRDMMISISPNCNPIATQGVQYDPTLYPVDTLTAYPFLKVGCCDTTFTLKFHIKLDCYSVNNQDFRITGPDGQPRAITNISANCDVNAETDSLTIHIPFKLGMNGRYFLYSKKGLDGNTLINKCGLPMDEFDTIVLIVDDCPPPPPPPPPIDTIDDIRNGDEPEPTPQPLPVVIPNVMSSNNDNVNDFLKIKNLNTWRTNKLTIYNRWGRVVYEKFDYNNDWDGYNVPAGVYYGTLEVNFETQHEVHIFNVTIIK
jgi:gliding motility-associated-like protein